MKSIRKVLILLLIIALIIGPAALFALARAPQPWDGNYVDYPDLYPDHTVIVGQSGGFNRPVGQPTTAYADPFAPTGMMTATEARPNGLLPGEVWTGRYVTYELAVDENGYVLMYEADVVGQMRFVGYEKDGIYYEKDGETYVPLVNQADAMDWVHDYSGWVTATLYAQARPYVYEDPNTKETISTLLEPEADGQQYVYMTSHLGEFSFEDEEMFRGFITGDADPKTGGFYVDETGIGVFKDPDNPNSHYVVWRVNADDIIDQVGETTIRLWLGKKDNPAAHVDPVNQLGQVFTSESTRAWFRPARDNGYYYTSQVSSTNLTLISFQPFSVNNGNNKGLDTTVFTDMTIDLQIRIPFSTYDNASGVKATDAGAVWHPAGMSNSGPKPAAIGGNYVPRAFEYHLYWVRGQSNQGRELYIITLREIDTGITYTYEVRAGSGNVDAVVIESATYSSTRTFAKPIATLDHHYYASTLAWGPLNAVPRYDTAENLEKWNGQSASFPVIWDSGTVIQTMAGSLSMKLLADVPPSTDLTIHKSLTGHWRRDWEVTTDTQFGLRLQTQTGQYIILNPITGKENEYTYGGMTSYLNNPQLNTLFFTSENAPAVLYNIPVENVLSEEQILAGIQPTSYTYTVVETMSGPEWERLQDWQLELVIPSLYDVDGETLEALRDEARPDRDPVLPRDKVLPNFQIGELVEGIAREVTLQNDFGHGVGFLRIYKFLTGYWRDLDVDEDTVFYVRIWDAEAENYLLFDPVPRMVGDMETLWCVGNHIVGLTEDYEQLLPNGDPRPQPIMEIPFSFNNTLLLSNLWTWGRYEVHEVMPTDAALASYLARYDNPALLSAEWQVAVEEMIAEEWTAIWEGIADADRDFDWAIRNALIEVGEPLVWPAGEWMADDWEDKWAPVYEILDELTFGIDTRLKFGVSYTESEQVEDGKLNFNEVVTWTASNKFKYPSTNMWIGKRLDGAYADWGIGPNTWFYMQVWNVPDEEDTAPEVQLIFERRRISGARGYDYHVIGHMDQEGTKVFYWIDQVEDELGILRPTPEEYYAVQYARNDIVSEVRVRSNLEQRVIGLPTEELFGQTFAGANYVVRERISTAARHYINTSYHYEDGYDSPSTPTIIEDDLRVLVTNYYNRGNGTLGTVTKWFPCGHGIYYGFCDYENHGIHSAACSTDSNTKNSTCESPHSCTIEGVEYICDTGGHYWCGGSNLHVKGEGDFATTSRENTWFLDGRPVDIDTTFYFTMSIWRWVEGLNPNEIEDGSYLPNSRNPNWVNPNTLEPGWIWPPRDQKGYFIEDPQWGKWEVLEFVLEEGVYNRIGDSDGTEAVDDEPQFMGIPTAYLPIAVSREVTLGNLGYQESYKITEYVATEYDLSGPIAFEPIETYQRINAEPDDPNGQPWVSYEVRHMINFTLPEKYLTFSALEFSFGQENLELAGIDREAYAELKPGDALTRAQATALMAGVLSVTDFGVTGDIRVPAGWSTDIPWSVIATATSILRDDIGITASFYSGLGPGVRLFADQANALIAMGVLSFEDLGIDGDILTLPMGWSPWAEGLPPYTHIVQGNRNVLTAYGVTAARYEELEQELLVQITLGQSVTIDRETATGLMMAGVFTAAELRGMAPINLFNNFRPSMATLEVSKNVTDWPTHFTGTPADQVYYFRVIDVTGSNRVLRWRTELLADTYFCLGNGVDHFADPDKFEGYNYNGLFGGSGAGTYTIIAIRDGQTIQLQNLWGEREYRVEEMVLLDGSFVPATLENAGYTPSYAYGTIESELQSSTERERSDLDDRAFLINGDVQAVTLTNTYPPYYAVNYNENGGAWDEDPQPAAAYYLEDDTVTVAEAEPIRDGYRFNGWNTAPDGSGTDYEAEDSFTMPPGDVTLYARWTPRAYTVTYVNGGGIGGPFFDGIYTVESPPVTVLGVGATGIGRTGYRFMGWATTDVTYPADATAFQAGDTFTMPTSPAKNVVLTAQWSEEYRLSYNGNGNTLGIAPTDSGRYIAGESATAAGRGSLARTGWSFIGWNTAPDGSGTDYEAGASVPFVDEDITLYAQWARVTYYVYYDGNGHTDGTPPATEEYFYDEEVTVRSPGDMVKENYRFIGWRRSLTEDVFLPGETFDMPPIDQGVHMIAIWEPEATIAIQKYLAGSYADWGIMPNTPFFVKLWCDHELAEGGSELRPLIFERTQVESGLAREFSYRAIGYLDSSTISATPIYYYPELDGHITDYVDVIRITQAHAQSIRGIPVGEEHNYFIEEVDLDPAMVSRIDISYTYNGGQPLGLANTIQILPWDEGEEPPDIDIVVTNRYTVGGGQAVLQKLFSSGAVEDHTVGDCMFAEEDLAEETCINEDHYFNFGLESRPYTWPGSAGQPMDGNPWWNDTVYYATMAMWIWDNEDYNDDIMLLTGAPQHGLRMPPIPELPVTLDEVEYTTEKEWTDKFWPNVVEGNGSRWYYEDKPGVGQWEVLSYTQADPSINEYILVNRGIIEDAAISFIPFSFNQKAYLNGMSVIPSYKITEYWGEPFADTCCPDCVLESEGDHLMCFIPIEKLHFIDHTDQPWMEYWVEHEINFYVPEDGTPTWDALPEQQATLEFYYALMGLLEDPELPDSAKAWYDSLEPQQALSETEGFVLIRAGVFSTDNLCGTAPVSIINNFHAGVAELEVTKVVTNEQAGYDSDQVYTIMITDMSFDTRLRWELESEEDGVRTYRCIGNDTDKFSDPGKSEDGNWQNYIELRAGETVILNNLWSNCTYQVMEYSGSAAVYTPEIWLRKSDATFDPTFAALDPEAAGFAELAEVHLQNGETGQVLINNIYPGEYTVTYESGVAGETISVPPAETVPIDTLYEVAPGPSRSGYIFLGWRNNRDGKLYQAPDGEDDDSFLMPRADVTLTAQWESIEYSVTYVDGSTGSNNDLPTDDALYNIGDTVTVKDKGGLLRPGYTFLGWRANIPGDTKVYLLGSDDEAFSMPADDVILTAVWETIAYEVTYLPGAGSGAVDVFTDPDGPYTVENANIGVLDNLDTESKPIYTRYGYRFVGWLTTDLTYLEGKAYFAPDETFDMPVGGVTFTALWETVGYTVTYESNYDDGETTEESYVSGPYTVENSAAGDSDPITVLTPIACGESGFAKPDLWPIDVPSFYRFLGWNTKADGTGTTYQPDETFDMPAENMTLYAQWEQEFIVFFYGNGNTSGTVPVDDCGHILGETTCAADKNTLARIGYTFTGWNTAADGSGVPVAAAIFDEDLGEWVLGGEMIFGEEPFGDGHIFLYAQWEVINYTVTYNPGAAGGTPYEDGFYTVENSVAGDDEPIVVLGLSDVGFAYPGYNFVGWVTTTEGVVYPEGTTCFVPGDTFDMPPRRVTLTAMWEFRAGDLTVLKLLDEVGPDDTGAYPFWDDPDNPYTFTFTVRDTGKDARLYFIQEDSDFELGGEETNVWFYVGDETIADILDEFPEAETVLPFRSDLPAVLKNLPADVEYEIAEDYDLNPEPDPYKDLIFFLPSYYYGGSTEWDEWEWFLFTMFGDSYDQLLVNMEDKGDVTVTVFNSPRMVLAWLYTVTYMGNGNTSGTPPLDPATIMGGYMQDTVVTVLGQNTLQRDGYTFAGWNTAEDGSGTAYQPDAAFTMPPHNVVLYAQWKVIDTTPPDPPNPPGPPNPPEPPEPPEPPDGPDLRIPFAPEHYAYLIGDKRNQIVPQGEVELTEMAENVISPEHNITRAEVATIFFRLITDEYRAQMWTQVNPFPDVALEQWFNNAISTMANAQVFVGMPDGTFQPNRSITRAEFATAVSRFFDAEYTGPNLFSDIEGHWAAREINAVANVGWIIGMPDGTFQPDREITRAEVATLMNRILVRHPETVDDLLPDMLTWPDNMNEAAWYYLAMQEATNSNEYQMKVNGIHKYWTSLIPNRPWEVLEKPYSVPGDING